ncbi:DUF6468 domain-containing protein [Gluconacetobacter sacchari]|uniref:DUF6468 domain-containing protein n=1 Tax=Gluconacetobacter sacchari TaxID=92759 RepID=UPI0039B3CE06
MLTQIQLIIEIVLSFFLLLGIIYSFYLSRILSSLRRDRESLMALVEKLEASVKSAEDGVEKLRVAGEVSGRPLSRMIELARVTGTELDSMVTKADATADRLETATIKASPHERKLERLLEKAAEVTPDHTLHVRNDLAPHSMRPETETAPLIDTRTGKTESGSSQPPAAPTITRTPNANPGDRPHDTLPAMHATEPGPAPGNEKSRNARTKTPASTRQTNQQLRRLENNFLGRPAR